MDGYEKIKVIGRGSYGCAILVRQRSPGEVTNHVQQSSSHRLFVIKQISLAAFEQQQQQQQDWANEPPEERKEAGGTSKSNKGEEVNQSHHHLSQAKYHDHHSSSSHNNVANSSAAAPVSPSPHHSSPSHLHHSKSQRPPHIPSLLVPSPPHRQPSPFFGGVSSHSRHPSITRALLNEVHILMRCGQGHPNICRYRASFLMTEASGNSNQGGGGGGVMMTDSFGQNQMAVSKAVGSQARAQGRSSSGGKTETLCIVMDFYAGGDLNRRIKHRTKQMQLASTTTSIKSSLTSSTSSALSQQLEVHFSEETILNYFVQLCLGLKHIHDSHILHRDLKTSNIFISYESARSFQKKSTHLPYDPSISSSSQPDVIEVLKIGDFGIARFLDSTSSLAHTRIGTPYYLAPEVCEGKNYSQKADIWSLGCCLYEMLTGKHAFNATNLNMLVLAILRGSYAPIPSVYSSRIHILLYLLFQRDPEKRPSALQLLSIPFLRDLIPCWLSARRIHEEFGVTDVNQLPRYEFGDFNFGQQSTSSHAEEKDQGLTLPGTTFEHERKTSASSEVSTSSSRRPHRPSKGPPSSLKTRPPVSPAAEVLAFERYTPSTSSQLYSATSQPESSASNVLKSHVTSFPSQPAASDGCVISSKNCAVTVSPPSDHSSSNTTASTPSPLPTLKSRPLILPAPPNTTNKTVAPPAVVLDSADNASKPALSIPSSHPPKESVTGWSLIDKDSCVNSASPPVINSPDDGIAGDTKPLVEEVDVTPSIPNSNLITNSPPSISHGTSASPSFQWQLPPALTTPSTPTTLAPTRTSRLPIIPSSSTLTEQCEQVRAYLEEHIPLPILKDAYKLMCTKLSSTTAASSPPTTSFDPSFLQLLQITQTHLISLLQQLVVAERVVSQPKN